MQAMAGDLQSVAGGVLQSPGLCVLVAEDDEADAYLICRALARQPEVAKVVHVSDGVVALWMVEQGQVAPDLAFIDLRMPRLGGLSLLSALAERSEPGFPMAVLTSSNALIDATRSRMRGAFRVISKPDSSAELEIELASAVAAACARRAFPDSTGLAGAAYHGIPSTPHQIALDEGLEPGDETWAIGR